jgi:hypothetical protein
VAENKYAKNAREFDKRSDSAEDVAELLDMKKAKIPRPGRKLRITIDLAEDLVHEIDRIKEKIGVD